MNNNKVPAPPPAVLPSVGRREPERSEGDRSATDGRTGADSKPRPDPEVVAVASRRRFSAEYKERILDAADRAKGSGGVGALLRREGLYSSLLATWRRERRVGVRNALTPQKRGPKSKRNPAEETTDKFRRENERLSEQLRKAEIVIDVQKKPSMLCRAPAIMKTCHTWTGKQADTESAGGGGRRYFGHNRKKN
jgi:transposase-like protein